MDCAVARLPNVGTYWGRVGLNYFWGRFCLHHRGSWPWLAEQISVEEDDATQRTWS